jgi:hypothetical protein
MPLFLRTIKSPLQPKHRALAVQTPRREPASNAAARFAWPHAQHVRRGATACGPLRSPWPSASSPSSSSPTELHLAGTALKGHNASPGTAVCSNCSGGARGVVVRGRRAQLLRWVAWLLKGDGKPDLSERRRRAAAGEGTAGCPVSGNFLQNTS